MGPKKLVWVLADQIAFGASTILALVLLTKYSGVSSAGQFSLALVPYVLATSVAQGVIVDRAVIAEQLSVPHEVARSRRLGAALGLISAPATFAMGVLSGMPTIGALLMCVVTPLACAQYVGRCIRLASSRPRLALWSDLAWLFPMVASLALVDQFERDQDRAVVLVAAWSAGAVIAAWLSGEPRGLWPARLATLIDHFKAHHSLGWESLIGQGTAQVTAVLLAGIASTSLVGTFRTAQSLTSPALLVAAAIRNPLLPLLVSVKSRPRLLMRALLVGGLLGACLGAALSGVIEMIPSGFGTFFLGRESEQVLKTSEILALDVGVASAVLISSLTLRALGRARTAAKIRGVNSVAALAGILLALTFDQSAQAAAWGLLTADLILLTIWMSVTGYRIRTSAPPVLVNPAGSI